MKKNQPKPAKLIRSPLGAFCAEHGITLSMLASLAGDDLGPPSVSSCHRLLNNELQNLKLRQRLMLSLARSLPEFLFKRGIDKAEIDSQLTKIFTEGEYKPMISQRLELTPDQCRFFGLLDRTGKPCDPFSTPPQRREDVFISPDLQKIVDRVIDAIKYPAFVAVTGEIGSGKSTLRALIEDHVNAHRDVHVIWPEFFDQGKVTAIQIARAILKYFGIQRLPRYSEDLGDLVKTTLATKHRNGERICLAFDECHRMSDDALSSLKNFFEMGSGGFQRYLGVVLLGQPLFEVRLNESKFRELLERIVILPMPDFQASAADYLRHRLRLVGISDIDTLFDQSAIDMVCQQATTPLAIGNIANAALRISKEDFNEPRVLGEMIKTKMFFATQTTKPQGFTRRAS